MPLTSSAFDHPGTEANFDELTNKHRHPQLVICPQKGASPVYVVLSDFLGYLKETPSIVSPPLHNAHQHKKLLIDVFSWDGFKVNPFPCNDNVLEWLLTDMNSDGFVERGNIRFGIEGVKNAEVLKVERIGETATPTKPTSQPAYFSLTPILRTLPCLHPKV